MSRNSKTVNFFVANNNVAWEKQSIIDKKFDVRNFHVDAYKQAFGRNSILSK
ncbi:MAG: hypothetical protein RR048_01670 [Oscillospiraceae bacterium]